MFSFNTIADYIKGSESPFKEQYEKILQEYKGKVNFDLASERFGNYKIPIEMLLDIAAVYQKQHDIKDLGGRQHIFWNYENLVDWIFATAKDYMSIENLRKLPQAKKDLLVTLATANQKHTLLMQFAGNNKLEGVKFCLEQKACNPKHIACRGANALTMNSSSTGKEAQAIQRLLLEKGCDELINLNDMVAPPLLDLCNNLATFSNMTRQSNLTSQEARIIDLLEAKADVNATHQFDQTKTTALMWVCQKDDLPLAIQLVKYKADVFAKNGAGKTALDFATDPTLVDFLKGTMKEIALQEQKATASPQSVGAKESGLFSHSTKQGKDTVQAETPKNPAGDTQKTSVTKKGA